MELLSFQQTFPVNLRRIQECVLFSSCGSKQYCFEKYPENAKHTFRTICFYKRNERECIVCKKYFQSNIALTQLLFFVKTTYFRGSAARGFQCIESVPKNIFDSAKDLGYFVNEIQKQKTENPFEKQWFEHFFS